MAEVEWFTFRVQAKKNDSFHKNFLYHFKLLQKSQKSLNFGLLGLLADKDCRKTEATLQKNQEEARRRTGEPKDNSHTGVVFPQADITMWAKYVSTAFL